MFFILQCKKYSLVWGKTDYCSVIAAKYFLCNKIEMLHCGLKIVSALHIIKLKNVLSQQLHLLTRLLHEISVLLKCRFEQLIQQAVCYFHFDIIMRCVSYRTHIRGLA